MKSRRTTANNSIDQTGDKFSPFFIPTFVARAGHAFR